MKIERPAGFTITELGEDHPVQRVTVAANGTTRIQIAYGAAIAPLTREQLIALRDALTVAIDGGEIEQAKSERAILIDCTNDRWYPLSNGNYTMSREYFDSDQRVDLDPCPNYGETRQYIEEYWGPVREVFE